MRQKLIVIGAGMATGRMLKKRWSSGGRLRHHVDQRRAARHNRIMLSPRLVGEKFYAEIVTNDDEW
jgi:nitrite reductase (NADH) large subunit